MLSNAVVDKAVRSIMKDPELKNCLLNSHPYSDKSSTARFKKRLLELIQEETNEK